MSKGICPKCQSLLTVNNNDSAFICPNCHEQILTTSAIKMYQRAIMAYSRKGEANLMGSSNYEAAYKNYVMLHRLKDDDLNVLYNVVISRIYCSTLHKLYIQEATDILLQGSDKVEIGQDNISSLSTYLTKIRTSSKLIVDELKKYASESQYALNMYHLAVKEYQYYVKAYLSIYEALDALNQYLEESKELLNEEINKAQIELDKKIEVKIASDEKHPFYDEFHKEINSVFPNNNKMYKTRIVFFALMGIGFVLSIIGLIMLGTGFDNVIAKYLILAIGLLLFIGGYFIQHNLRAKIYHLKY